MRISQINIVWLVFIAVIGVGCSNKMSYPDASQDSGSIPNVGGASPPTSPPAPVVAPGSGPGPGTVTPASITFDLQPNVVIACGEQTATGVFASAPFKFDGAFAKFAAADEVKCTEFCLAQNQSGYCSYLPENSTGFTCGFFTEAACKNSSTTGATLTLGSVTIPGLNVQSAAGGTVTPLANLPRLNLASPLIIEDEPGEGIVSLNPLSTSTYFDLHGDGLKSRISCVTKGAFLALPDFDGQIANINQLFGNNTIGPDGTKAATGFLALAKHDSNRDGVIDRTDPVFSKLRLWHDFNCDGVAQANELNELEGRNIKAIRVADAVSMFQPDQWGNVIAEGNFVELIGGKLKMIYDLWFQPN